MWQEPKENRVSLFDKNHTDFDLEYDGNGTAGKRSLECATHVMGYVQTPHPTTTKAEFLEGCPTSEGQFRQKRSETINFGRISGKSQECCSRLCLPEAGCVMYNEPEKREKL